MTLRGTLFRYRKDPRVIVSVPLLILAATSLIYYVIQRAKDLSPEALSSKNKNAKKSGRTVWLFYHTTPDLPLIFPLTRSSRRLGPPSPARLPRLLRREESARRISNAARGPLCTR